MLEGGGDNYVISLRVECAGCRRGLLIIRGGILKKLENINRCVFKGII